MGQIRHIASSLRLFVPNSLMVYHRTFFFPRVLLAMSVLVLLLRRLFFNRLHPLPLRALVPSGSLISFGQSRFTIFIVGLSLSPSISLAVEAGACTLPAPAVSAVSFPCRRGSTPPQGPFSCFPIHAECPVCLLYELLSESLVEFAGSLAHKELLSPCPRILYSRFAA
jgi:hypothetical protein